MEKDSLLLETPQGRLFYPQDIMHFKHYVQYKRNGVVIVIEYKSWEEYEKAFDSNPEWKKYDKEGKMLWTTFGSCDEDKSS